MEKLKVVIADDHPIVLLGVRELMERDDRFEIVGETLSSQGLIQKLESCQVDVVITDYNMPGDSPYGDGLKLVEYLKRNFPHVQVLILTMISNQLILTRLRELGVVGVIQKSQLHEEIQIALKGHCPESRVSQPGAGPQFGAGIQCRHRRAHLHPVAQGVRDSAPVRFRQKCQRDRPQPEPQRQDHQRAEDLRHA